MTQRIAAALRHLQAEGLQAGKKKTNHRLGMLKIQAILELTETPRIGLTSWTGDHPLYIQIHRKKLAQIQSAATSKDLKAILAPPSIRRTAEGTFEPATPWVLPEEEIILWANASLLGPLGPEAMKRYGTVFGIVYPDRADVFNQKS